MTARCPSGGASQIIPGVGPEVVLGSALITGTLLAVAPWLFPFAALVDTFNYEALTQCTSDPPAMPVFTGADYVAMGLPLADLAATATALGKINDLLLNWAWAQYCQCVSGSATLPPYSVPPAGVASPTGSASTPCFTGSTTFVAANDPGGGVPAFGPTGITPGTLTSHSVGGGAVPFYVLPSPLPASVAFTVTTTVLDANTHNLKVGVLAYDAANTFLGFTTVTAATSGAGPQTTTFGYSIPPTTAWWRSYAVDVTSFAGGVSLNWSATWTCAGGSSSGVSEPCTDSPVLLNILNAIWQEVQLIYSALPSPLTSYAESTVHAGLTGSNHFTLGAGTIAIKAAITAIAPGTYTEIGGDPNYYIEAGIITFSAAEGNYHSYKLTSTPQLIVAPALSDTLHYTLEGSTVTVTELVRGP